MVTARLMGHADIRTLFGMLDSAEIQRSAAAHTSGITVSEARFSFFTLQHQTLPPIDRSLVPSNAAKATLALSDGPNTRRFLSIPEPPDGLSNTLSPGCKPHLFKLSRFWGYPQKSPRGRMTNCSTLGLRIRLAGRTTANAVVMREKLWRAFLAERALTDRQSTRALLARTC